MLSPQFPHQYNDREEASAVNSRGNRGNGFGNYEKKSSSSNKSKNFASVGSNKKGGRSSSNFRTRNIARLKNGVRGQPQYEGDSYDDYDYDYRENSDDEDDFNNESSSRFLANSIRYPNNNDTINNSPYHQHQQQTPASKLLDIIEHAMPNTSILSPRYNKNKKDYVEVEKKQKILKETWSSINRWLWEHSSEEISDAMTIRGKDDATPLHYICQLPNTPAEIVQKFVSGSHQSVMLTDIHGWLPLHHACAHNASTEVLKILIDANKVGTTKQDSHQRTPLHFYLIQCTSTMDMNAKTIAENVHNLSQMGAPKRADTFGMLPIHYACAYGVPPLVLTVLKDAYPESIWAQDHKGRTLMHLAMANAYRDASPGVTKFLIENSVGIEIGGEESTIGGSNMNNTNPLDGNERLVNIRDKDGFLPMHLMPLGLRHFRGDHMEDYHDQRNNVCECLKIYLAAKPTASADFLTALQDLPEWLQDVAVVTTHVRNILNQKIVGIFPTFMLFFEFVMYITIILVFDRISNASIKAMFNCINDQMDASEEAIDVLKEKWLMGILWFGATYFLFRELIQIVSLWSLGSISRWFKDPYNWLDVTVIVLLYYFVMTVSPKSANIFIEKLQNCEDVDFAIAPETFRSFAAFTKFILLMAVISFLRATLFDFAIVVGGVIYVTKRLGAFFLAVIVILITFAQIFYFLYYETDICKCYYEATKAVNIFDSNGGNDALESLLEGTLTYISRNCSSTSILYNEARELIMNNMSEYIHDYPKDEIYINEDMYPHCEFSRSILKVVTMMMGEIGNEGRYVNNLVAQWTYIAYAIIVVILLSNILIAIVTESYEVIQNDRAASVFLGNRLDFIAEMDAISHAIIRRLPEILGGRSDDRELIVDEININQSIHRSDNDKGYFYHGWRKVIELFDENFYDMLSSPTKVEFWCYLLYQFLAIVIIIPVWLVLGLLTFGILWPPQIREMILVENKTNVISKKDIEKQKLNKLKNIEKRVEQIQMDLTSEILIDRAEIKRVKNQVQMTQDAVKTDLEQIRELMQTLLELGT